MRFSYLSFLGPNFNAVRAQRIPTRYENDAPVNDRPFGLGLIPPQQPAPQTAPLNYHSAKEQVGEQVLKKLNRTQQQAVERGTMSAEEALRAILGAEKSKQVKGAFDIFNAILGYSVLKYIEMLRIKALVTWLLTYTFVFVPIVWIVFYGCNLLQAFVCDGGVDSSTTSLCAHAKFYRDSFGFMLGLSAKAFLFFSHCIVSLAGKMGVTIG